LVRVIDSGHFDGQSRESAAAKIKIAALIKKAHSKAAVESMLASGPHALPSSSRTNRGSARCSNADTIMRHHRRPQNTNGNIQHAGLVTTVAWAVNCQNSGHGRVEHHHFIGKTTADKTISPPPKIQYTKTFILQK